MGDTIIEVDGRRVQTITEFARSLEAVGIGNEVQLTVLRDGRTRTVTVVVQNIDGQQ